MIELVQVEYPRMYKFESTIKSDVHEEPSINVVSESDQHPKYKGMIKNQVGYPVKLSNGPGQTCSSPECCAYGNVGVFATCEHSTFSLASEVGYFSYWQIFPVHSSIAALVLPIADSFMKTELPPERAHTGSRSGSTEQTKANIVTSNVTYTNKGNVACTHGFAASPSLPTFDI